MVARNRGASVNSTVQPSNGPLEASNVRAGAHGTTGTRAAPVAPALAAHHTERSTRPPFSPMGASLFGQLAPQQAPNHNPRRTCGTTQERP